MKKTLIADCGCTIVFIGRPKPLPGECFDEEYHGMKGTSEYERWKNMKRRCFYGGTKCDKYYKDKGIGVCRQWAESFASFYRDLGPAPFKTASMDRIDGNKHYCPHNIRWATKKEQVDNRNIPDIKVKYRIIVDGRCVANFEKEEDAISCLSKIRIEKVKKWT